VAVPGESTKSWFRREAVDVFSGVLVSFGV
jgi:hypothetical protein